MNGDIHFAPYGAAVGQKISGSTGLASTYALVATPTNGYAGAVLAPNGDVHFIPSSATVGQKVSSTGVVSTYSILFGTTNNFGGGVIGDNGEIHYIPFSAPRGQKISTLPAQKHSPAYNRSGFSGSKF
jgi:hypothetical protein